MVRPITLSGLAVAEPLSVINASKNENGVIRRQKNSTVPSLPTDKDNAALEQELILAFDPELRGAAVSRLIEGKEVINRVSVHEQRLSHFLETARINALESARARGIAQAQQEAAQKTQKEKARQQKHFIDTDLPRLIDSCEHLGFDTVKTTAENLAKMFDIKLAWEETDDGFTCTANAE